MSELIEGDARERDWAAAHFRAYLLGQLTMDDAERVASAVALIPGFVSELERVEESLIEEYLDHRLGREERGAFESRYARGTEVENLAKLRLHQVLRSPELEQILKAAPGQPVPLKPSSARRPFWSWQTVALATACAAAIILALLYQSETHKLAGALAELNSKKAPVVPATPQETQPVEQPAGITSSGGLVLPAAPGTVKIGKPPSSIIWSPVPDYRQRYEVRVYAASGQALTSGAVHPKDNAIEYSPAGAGALALPWDIFILGPAGKQEKVLAHYILNP